MPTDRTDFLREYYRLLADDIRRSEAVIPKVCALEEGTMALLLLACWAHQLAYLAPLLVLLTSAWAIHQLINANLWARRSHLMAANVEMEFFASDDLDVLLPRSYYADARRYRYRRVFIAPLLLSLAFFVIALVTLPATPGPKLFSLYVLSALLLGSLFIENRHCEREYAYLVAHAPGRGRNATN